MWFQALCVVMAIVGFLVTSLFLIAMTVTAFSKYQQSKLQKQTLLDSMNDHKSRIIDLEVEVRFLKSCEQERTNRENEASRKANKKGAK